MNTQRPAAPISYEAPASIEEALQLLAEGGPHARPLAGGTDLIPQVREGRKEAALFVDIKRIPELREIRWDAARGLTIGAAATCWEIARHFEARRYPALVDACSMIGSVLIQHRATLAGNLCNAAPSADGIPPLIVHQAVAEIAGPGGRREAPVEAFCAGPGRTQLRPGELVVALRLPPPAKGTVSSYVRFTPRNEMDIAVAGASAAVTLDAQGVCVQARISLSAVAPTPVRAEAAEAFLEGHPLTEERIAEAARLAVKAASPIDDVRGSAAFRRHLVEVLTRRTLVRCVEDLGGAARAG